MRIAKIKNGHYAKVLSPQFTGVIARVYEEIRERKAIDVRRDQYAQEQKLKTDQIASRIAAISIRYEEMNTILKRLFPVDETKAYIDRSLEVDGSIKAHAFIATTEDASPFTLSSTVLVKNLNAEFIGGKSIVDFESNLESKAVAISTRLEARMTEERDASEKRYAPMAHVNAGGPGIHPYATEAVAGFMSDTDKTKLNKMIISETPPESPRLKQIWMDIS